VRPCETQKEEEHVPTDAPKSAVELVMERLRQQDATESVESAPLTEEQKLAIAAARQSYVAKVAEAEILHNSALASTLDPEARQQLAANHRRDLAQFASARDRKIAAVRKGDPGQ
jgi:hypothetical protein